MPYVSARYAPADPTFRTMPGEPVRVIATDDQGAEFWLTEDSQVGDWLRYLEDGGTIDPVAQTKPGATG